MSFEIGPSSAPTELSSKFAAALLPLPEQEDTPEPEKAVKLYDRTAKERYHATAPSGDAMMVVPFAEYPSFHKDSFSNREMEKVKEITRY